jgi:hypothetical protein
MAIGMIIMPMTLPRMSPTQKTQHKRENKLEKHTITKKGSNTLKAGAKFTLTNTATIVVL